ncbi:MAG: hypothetical protein ACOX74_03585 [Lachnospiraceae bacterium]|jgi:hypothetical protein
MTIEPIAAALSASVILMIVIIALAAVFVVLTIYGRKQEKKYAETQRQVEEAARPATILVIDKKQMKMTEAGFPKFVMDSLPKQAKRAKVYVVKAKIGPKIQPFMCSEEVFNLAPKGQSVRAMISGFYITEMRSVRGPALVPDKKLSWRERIKKRAMKDV